MGFWDFFSAHPVLGALAGMAMTLAAWSLAHAGIASAHNATLAWLRLKYAPECDCGEDEGDEASDGEEAS